MYAILSENLYHVSSALTTMEINMKSYSGSSAAAAAAIAAARAESSDAVTNL